MPFVLTSKVDSSNTVHTHIHIANRNQTLYGIARVRVGADVVVNNSIVWLYTHGLMCMCMLLPLVSMSKEEHFDMRETKRCRERERDGIEEVSE